MLLREEEKAIKHVFDNFHIEGCFFEWDLLGGGGVKGWGLNSENMVCLYLLGV